MVLEQLAWASEIDRLRDPDAIHRTKAEGSIPALRKTIKFAGNLYGWLSAHTHWRYDGHIKAMIFSEDRMAAMLGSSRFKAVSLTVALLLLASTTHTLKSLRTDATSSVLLMPPDARLEPEQLSSGAARKSSALSRGRSGPSVAEIRSLLTLSLPLDLIDEIRNAAGADEDIVLLARMADELRKAVTGSQ
jgi:hypothetical protein